MSFRPRFHRAAAGAIALVAAFAGPASALSCLAPDPVAAFARANAATEVYVVVIGTFSGGPGPRGEDLPRGSERSYLARFEGRTLGRDGPVEAVARDVVVEETCVADQWCAELSTGTEVLTFLRVDTAGQAVLTLEPCYANVFYDPDPAQRAAIRDCFVNGCTEM